MNEAQKLLRWFDTGHMTDPAVIALVGMFRATAEVVANAMVGAEAEAAVRKLLEAKDCAVRDYIQGRDQ